MLLEKLTTREVAGEVFDAIKTNNSFTSIATTAAELTGKQVRRLHLDPLLWLIEKAVFNKNVTRTSQVVVVSLNEKSTEDSSSNKDLLINRTRRISKSWERKKSKSQWRMFKSR